MALHLKNILDKENIKYKVEDIGFVINSFYPDIRKILNYTQQNSINKELKLVKSDAPGIDLKHSIVDLLKLPNTFNDIRQLIANNKIKHYDDVYQILFDNVSEYATGKETLIILIIAEYMHQSALVINKEITFMACIVKIQEELYKNE